ncbi:MAG: HU family DNA-binding protein [Betaproteobacteria bacterium]|nr:HU family DNA-binding protein [Betaproteobacteria bacterium]
MNKAQLIEILSAQTGLSKISIGGLLDEFTTTVVESVAKGDAVTLVGFGTFKASPRSAREGRNPKTGEKIMIPPCLAPRFVPSGAFKEHINAFNGKKPPVA